jgi:hypothetical protein
MASTRREALEPPRYLVRPSAAGGKVNPVSMLTTLMISSTVFSFRAGRMATLPCTLFVSACHGYT